MTSSTVPKTSWADDVDELDQSRVPKREETVDENGIITVVEYGTNDEGKKVKITKKIRRTLQKAVVEHAVAERKNWSKFGQERGNKPGPDRATTTVGENVSLKISAGNKSSEPEPSPEDTIKASLAKAGAGKVLCRMCKGDHFTARCPYKDSLAGLESVTPAGLDTPPAGDEEAAPAGPPSGKYVPPSMRAGAASRSGEAMGRPGMNRDDLPTLRVTNVSEDTTDQDLRDLFSNFGRVVRVYIGRDRETGQGKGYAFVSFEDRANAERAIQKVNGMGYDSLILNVGWSQPRESRS
ncbi:translation initiation factor eIF3g [Pyrrhoderma noxium]|uniref:Eukaryotic translation initiation factor 3 subunit G n=1 Tax=Pyrrhoderma noxium TaxID=2282107 RepID=A0A286ULF4_9AGAM|nr:translation initiation factor eIF3g [Pyrrhoderma noxium]